MDKVNKKTPYCYCLSNRCLGCIYFRTVGKGVYTTDCVLKRRKKSLKERIKRYYKS